MERVWLYNTCMAAAKRYEIYHIQLPILFVLDEVVTFVSAEISMTTHGCRDEETEMKV